MTAEPQRDLFGVAADLAERPKTHRRLRTRRPLPGFVLTAGSQAPIRDQHDVIVGAVVRTAEGRHAAWAHRRKVGVFDTAGEAEIAARWQIERLDARRKARRRRWENER